MGRGVTQGRSLPPVVFSIDAEAMVRKALADHEEEMKVGGELKAVRSAVCQQHRRRTPANGRLDRIASASKMKVNVTKTEVRTFARKDQGAGTIRIESQTPEEGKKFK